MSSKHVTPAIDRKSFSCPHCGAHADQTWFSVHAYQMGTESRHPHLATIETAAETVRESLKQRQSDPEAAERLKKMATRLEQQSFGHAILTHRRQSDFATHDLDNVHVTLCYTCRQPTIWLYDKILYPSALYEIEPNEDMDDDIRADFDEARSLLDISPRASAALLRLCLQKLCKQLGQQGKNINDDIAALVQSGLKPQVQQALDLVRVVGNNAVHPGTIDLKDDRETAVRLFELVNRIAHDMITHPKEIDKLYNTKVPASTQDAIQKRDGIPKP